MQAGARWMLPAVMAVALIAVPPIAQSQSTSPVIQLLLNSSDVRTRIQAARTLGRLRPPGAREALETALGDGNPAVRLASVEALGTLGDPLALRSLRGHANDRDNDTRALIARTITALERSTPQYGASVASASPAAAPGGGGSGSGLGSLSDWTRARYVLRVGTLANRADNRAGIVDVLRNAIMQEGARTTDVAFTFGVMPPEAERRVRTGHLHAYAIEGSINTLRRWTVAATLSVRAEVSLVLMTEPTRAIVGSLSGAATAQEHTPYYDADAFTQRLEARALTAAVHGAMNNLQASLQTTHGH